MFGKEMRCPECNQYVPDRCTCDEWQSNAQWPEECYQGMYGDGVSTDKHRNKEAAYAVCGALEIDGFGGDGEYFPMRTWVTKAGAADPILEEIREERDKVLELKRLWEDVNDAQEEIEQLRKDRIVPDDVSKERFDI